MKISVIVPVYNVELYLADCICSILAQSYNDIELVLVDDGSTDSCGTICNEYAAKDARITVIHKTNGGLSDARNAGIAVATGDYVVFLDSDDFWSDPHALMRLVERQKETNADIINYSYIRWFEDTGEQKPYFKGVPSMPLGLTKEQQLEYLTTNGLYIASACNKMIRRNILDELEFRKGVYSEDIEWCAELLTKANSVDFVCENFYMYRQHSTSIRHTINKKKCDDLANNILICFRLIEKADSSTKAALMRYAAFQFGTFFVVQAQSAEIPIESINALQQYRWILKYHGNNKKLLILHIGCKLLGYKTLCKAIRCLYGDN